MFSRIGRQRDPSWEVRARAPNPSVPRTRRRRCMHARPAHATGPSRSSTHRYAAPPPPPSLHADARRWRRPTPLLMRGLERRASVSARRAAHPANVDEEGSPSSQCGVQAPLCIPRSAVDCARRASSSSVSSEASRCSITPIRACPATANGTPPLNTIGGQANTIGQHHRLIGAHLGLIGAHWGS